MDVAAGIGRKSKFFLCENFEQVDALEQCKKFLDKAKTYINSPKMRNFYVIGVQNFDFECQYDLIWNQWILAQLTDEDMVAWLKKCCENLKPNGVVVCKENISRKDYFLDKDDNSVMRPLDWYRGLFQKMDLEVLIE